MKKRKNLPFDDVLMLLSGFYRDLLRWLFSSITKSTEREESKETTGEREEHIRFHLK